MNYEILKEIDGETFLCADPHFGHLRVFEVFEPVRQTIGKNLEDFEKNLINLWNKEVSKQNIVLILGDFAINKLGKTEEIGFQKTFENVKSALDKLNGRKILVKGNHDTLPNEYYIKAGFELVVDKPIIIDKENKYTIIENFKTPNIRFAGSIVKNVNDTNVLFSHFGVFDKNDDRLKNKYKNEMKLLNDIWVEHNCMLNIHGHVHGNIMNIDNMECVSVEQIDFTPQKCFQIIKNNKLRNK